MLLVCGIGFVSVAETTNAVSGVSGSRPVVQSAGTLRMAARLRQLAEAATPSRNFFLNRERATTYGARLRNTTNLALVHQWGPTYATELLNAGDSERAMRQFHLLSQFYREVPEFAARERAMGMQLGEAMSAIRLGEQENCLVNHNSQSCLFPFRPAAFHKLPRGSMAAIPVLTNLLAEAPEDLRARWLLNIAFMTLGQWPDGVPAAARIGPEVFASEYSLPEFPEIAGAVGLNAEDLGGGTVVEDFDNDGFLDVLISGWGLRSPLHLFHNDGNGHFTERTHEAGLDGLWGGLNLISADYNNDGFVDVMVLRGAWLGREGHLPNSLLRNNGDGTFTDVTEEAHIYSEHPTQTAVWWDYDGDGWLDLFIGNESQDPERGDRNPCELYHNNRDGTFTEIAEKAGLAVVAFVKGTATADFDGDGRPDLYLSLRSGNNRLFHNDGPVPGSDPNAGLFQFTDVTDKAGVRGPNFGFPTWFFDYDQDGLPDLFVGGYHISDVGDAVADYLHLPTKGSKPKLYHNNGDGTFKDVTAEAHLDRVLHGMGSNFGDLDNDGYPDFYIGTGDPDLVTLIPNRMFRNAEGRFFQDVTTATHTGHLQKGHGCAFADLDNDGDQDVFMNMGGAYSGDTYHKVLFLNPGTPRHHWVTLKLVGRKANRAGIGARIRVNVDAAAGPRSIYKWVNTGGSFGANPLRAEIGLGEATAIRSIEVRWPAPGGTQTLPGVALDQFYTITEGDAAARPWAVKRIRFDPNAHPAAHADATPPAGAQ